MHHVGGDLINIAAKPCRSAPRIEALTAKDTAQKRMALMVKGMTHEISVAGRSFSRLIGKVRLVSTRG